MSHGKAALSKDNHKPSVRANHFGKSLSVCLAVSKSVLYRSAQVCWLRVLLCPFAEEDA